MRPNIAFDIDGVVAKFADAFVPYAKKRYGLEFIPKDVFHWDVEPDITPLLFEKLIAWFIRDHSNKIKSYGGGSDLVDYVWQKTCKPITFITARHEMTVAASHSWIRAYFPSIDPIIITVDSGTDKMRYLNDFDCFIDDRRRTALQLVLRGKVVFMPKRKYNWPIGTLLDCDNFKAIKDNLILLENYDAILSGAFDHLIFKP